MRSDCNWKTHIQAAARSVLASDTTPHFVYSFTSGWMFRFSRYIVSKVAINICADFVDVCFNFSGKHLEIELL